MSSKKKGKKEKIKNKVIKEDVEKRKKITVKERKINRAIVGAIDPQWQMDLADMQSMQKFNGSYRYLLVCIDVLSKYA